MPIKRLIKFFLIFGLTGTSSLYVSNFLLWVLEILFDFVIAGWLRIIFILVLYQFLLVGFCHIFKETDYILKKGKRLKKLLFKI
tara:strand:+ start:582 stop:833 length:252 start_codon:yes stop_codon:yes gene_type:complete